MAQASDREHDPTTCSHAVLESIIAALRDLRFGTVEIVIHDGKVVQIERKEKLRLHHGHGKT